MKPTIWSLDTAKTRHRFSPGIAAALPAILPRTAPVLDLGCGRGDYLKVLSENGYSCLGVEGTQGIREIATFQGVVEADLTLPLAIDWPKSSVLCLEVAEHIHARNEVTLLDSIDRFCLDRLVLSWAVPGQKGHGHVNCRPNSYVCRQLARRGFDVLAEETFILREQAEDHVAYFRNTLIVFARRARIADGAPPPN